ncbi:MAG: hypothetical protein ACXVRG_05415, partial [Gaiellaceae bacterium]
MFTNTTRGRSSEVARAQTRLVCTSTPITALRVVEGAVVVVSAVMGVEVGTGRAWHRAGDDGLARLVVVN